MRLKFKKRRFIALGMAIFMAWVSVGCTPKSDVVDTSKEFETLEELISRSSDTVRIEAVTGDQTGVDVNSKFKIVADNNMDLSLDKESIRVIPEQSFSIDKVSKSEYTLEFEEELKPDSIYRIAVENEKEGLQLSKAFQTRKEFRIKSTLPRHQATYVPVNSGIEMTFTRDDIAKIDEFFEITPAVKGTFETHKETMVFVPEKLDYATNYTVKIKKGMGLKDNSEILEEDYIFQFQTEMEKTTDTNYNTMSFMDKVYNYTSKEAPMMSLYADGYYRNKELDVQLYRYKNDEEFIKDLRKYETQPFWAIKSSKNNLFDKSKLQEALSFKGKVVDLGSPWYKQILEFPSNIEEGYYLVSIAYEDKEFITHMQINNMSVYMMMGDDKSLAWVHDSVTGEPIPGVKAGGEGVVSSTSNDKGIVEFEISQENTVNQYIVTLSQKGRVPFVTFLDTNPSIYMYSDDSANVGEKYWSYLYLDRGKYLPSDTIQVWGVAKPRNEGKISQLTVQVEKYAYDMYREDTSAVLLTEEVTVSPYGTYTCALEYKSFNPGSYYITVKAGEEILERRYFQVEKYTKPAYKIQINPDKKAYFPGEDVYLAIQSTFFEGSPVAGLKVNYRGESWDYNIKSIKGSLTSDGNGLTSLKHLPQLSIADAMPFEWRPIRIYYTVNNAAAEEEEIYGSAAIQFFPRDVMIHGEGKVENNQFVMEIGTHKINLDALNKKDADTYLADNYKGSTIDIALKGKLVEERWDKKEVGQYYDFINKVTRKKYDYYRVETVIDELDMNTVQGKATYRLPYKDFSSQRTYYLELTGKDQKGRAVKETIYLYQSYIDPWQLEYMEMLENYSIKEDGDNYTFKAGDKANLVLLKNQKEFELNPNGAVLYFILKDGIQSIHVMKDDKVDIEFIKEYIPNAYVKMIYFDGSRVHDAGMFGLFYDYKEQELDIKVTPDKSDYQPGDKVQLNIQVKDKDNKPSEAEVNISAVDEAFFAMWNQYVDTLGDIYRSSFGTGIRTEYFSYENNGQQPPFAECGEGGDSAETRHDFKDNAYFGSVTTGKDGKGTLQFTLPDNLTSWRITYQGLTQDLRAGSGKENIQAKLPFFVNLLFNDIYLEKDQPGLSLRTFGTAVKQGDTINYKVVLTSPDNQETTYAQKGKAGSYSHFILPSLAIGDYSITVYAESGKLKDSIRKDFKVVQSMIETARTNYFDLMEDMDIAGSVDVSNENGITEWVFYNKGISNYYRALNSLYYSWGQRVDQVLSRKMAGEYLKKYFDKEYMDDNEKDLSRYQIYDGGIALFSYDSSSPMLSAMVASAAKESFDKVDLRSYFYNKIADEKTTFEDLALCYWGLAALEEPVLLDIYELLERKDISLNEKLYYGIALAELGDDATAKKIYLEVLKKYGKVVKPYVYLESGKDRDENIRITALCAIMGIKSNHLGHEELFKYILDNSTDEILTKLEKLIYVTSKTPDTKKESSFEYTSKGKSEKVTLNGLERYRLVLASDAWKDIEFSGIKGDVELAFNYIGSVKDLSQQQDNLVKMTRSYSVGSKVTNTLTQSDKITVKLELAFDKGAPEGYYQVTDVLPSGLKYIQPNSEQQDYYWGNVNGQKITFMYYYTPNKPQSKGIQYSARVIAPGQYTAEGAVIIHGRSQAHGFTESSLVKIVSVEE